MTFATWFFAWRFPPQGAGNGRHRRACRPESRRRCRPRLETLETRDLPAVTLLENFPDINIDQTLHVTPPDTQMAVGPNTVVGAVNRSITLTDKTGGARVGPILSSTFFASIGDPNGRYSDCQVMYDDQAGRFYFSTEEVNPVSTLSTIDFAVSKTNSPATLTAADWTFFPRITSVNEGGTEFPDFPKMGWNNDAVFFSTNQFSSVSPVVFDHNLILAISKASILAGGPLNTHQTAVNVGFPENILIPARMHNESAGNLEFFVQATGGGGPSTTVNVVTQTGYLSGAGAFSMTQLTVNAYTNSPGVPGLAVAVIGIDDRLLSADWVNNGTAQHLVASGNAGVGGVNLARWYEFNAPTAGTPSLLQQGDINPGGGVSTSYPSIAINPLGSIAMTFLENGGGQSTSMYVAGRVATDPLNTMQTSALVKAGATPAWSSMVRGGDYSATEYDPSAPGVFWSANEYQLDNTNFAFWGTQIAQFSVKGLALTVPPDHTAGEGAGPAFNLGSFTDPDAGPWAVDVNWGDGTAHTSFSAATAGSLGTRSHTYAEEGSYTVTVKVTGGTGRADSKTFHVAVADAPLTAAATAIDPTAGAPFSGVVATFTDADPAGTVSDYTATITWGDGTNSTGSVTSNGSDGFKVTGYHTYAAAGNVPLTVVINDVGRSTATPTATAYVTRLGFGPTQDLNYWVDEDPGQALIKSFNGGPAHTELSAWLATTFPKLYGAQAGSHNLTGKTNAQVAAFLADGLEHNEPAQQVLATALNVYATTWSLGGTAGEAAGFRVTLTGLGAHSYSVGNDGAAFGVANGTSLTVAQILTAVNDRAVSGVLYNGNDDLQDQARHRFAIIDQRGRTGVRDSQTATIGFWHGDDGQALIKSFNGGQIHTELSAWLVSNFGNLYGASAGSHNLTGKTNTQVAAFFQGLFNDHHDGPDVEVLATTLDVYATTGSLGGAQGQSYGFAVTAEGLGASSFNVQDDGAAFGVANDTTLNVYQLLQAVNARAVGGVLYGGNAVMRDLAEDLFERLNRASD
jgi:hypothetical protein